MIQWPILLLSVNVTGFHQKGGEILLWAEAGTFCFFTSQPFYSSCCHVHVHHFIFHTSQTVTCLTFSQFYFFTLEHMPLFFHSVTNKRIQFFFHTESCFQPNTHLALVAKPNKANRIVLELDFRLIKVLAPEGLNYGILCLSAHIHYLQCASGYSGENWMSNIVHNEINNLFSARYSLGHYDSLTWADGTTVGHLSSPLPAEDIWGIL